MTGIPSPTLTDRQRQALTFLVEAGHASASAVADHLWPDGPFAQPAAASAILARLRDKGYTRERAIPVTGGRPAHTWEPTEAGRKALA